MDPYRELGVDRNASDEDIKKAYRELVKKYHPDKYADSELKDLASEKLKKINAAYDEIQKIRSGKQTGGSYGSYSGSYNSYGGGNSYNAGPKYQAVWQKIQMGDLGAAESMLDAMQDRDAEWYYLKGTVLMRRGFYDGARQNFERAVNMEPSNMRYRQAYASASNIGNRGFRDFYGGNGSGGNADCGDDCCNVCASMMCLDCLCGSFRCC